MISSCAPRKSSSIPRLCLRSALQARCRVQVVYAHRQLPESLHDSARELAKKERISINRLITLALAEKVSALMAEEYLGKRAKRGDKRKFHKAMAKVANIKPEE